MDGMIEDWISEQGTDFIIILATVCSHVCSHMCTCTRVARAHLVCDSTSRASAVIVVKLFGCHNLAHKTAFRHVLVRGRLFHPVDHGIR